MLKSKNTLLSALFIFCALLFSFAPAGDEFSKRYKAFFGCTYSDNVIIDAATFKQMMQKPLCAKDSVNNIIPIKSFELIYAESGLYQDSTGLPIIYTDYTNDIFVGDTINTYWKNNFNERLYRGDTIIFDRIICSPDGKKNFMCKTLKVIIK